MPRYALTIAYDGTDFHGWQKQHPPNLEPLRTVQGLVESAVEELIRESVHVLGASRTDSGVHAEGQIACFTTDVELAPEILPAALSSRLPDDVLVRHAEIVDPIFNPISDAEVKRYRYRLAHGRMMADSRPLFDRHTTAWCARDLDVELMKRAAGDLVGEHDFAAFTKIRHGRDSTVREIFDCSVEEESSDRLRIEVSGNGFLWNMVRIIAGTLVEIGEGRLPVDAIPGMLDSGDRREAGRTMPPEGLCLMWIRFGAPGSGKRRRQMDSPDADQDSD